VLDPEDFVAADAAASGTGFEVIGFYHSHPRGPARLSQVDRAGSWPGYVYLLIFPETRSGSGISAWVQPTAGAPFLPVVIDPREKPKIS
jgi:proteasome lid subunit RPN8/RPN11